MDAPTWLAERILANAAERGLPRLDAVVTAPTLHTDGLEEGGVKWRRKEFVYAAMSARLDRKGGWPWCAMASPTDVDID